MTDRKGLLLALKHGTFGFRKVHCDVCASGAVGTLFTQGGRDRLGTQVTGLIANKVMPKPWRVGQRFAWLEKTRRFGEDCKRTRASR